MRPHGGSTLGPLYYDLFPRDPQVDVVESIRANVRHDGGLLALKDPLKTFSGRLLERLPKRPPDFVPDPLEQVPQPITKLRRLPRKAHCTPVRYWLSKGAVPSKYLCYRVNITEPDADPYVPRLGTFRSKPDLRAKSQRRGHGVCQCGNAITIPRAVHQGSDWRLYPLNSIGIAPIRDALHNPLFDG